MELKYFVLDYRSVLTLFKIDGSIHERTILEVYSNGQWKDNLNASKFFMRQVLSGWIDDDDQLTYETAMSKLSEKIQAAKSLAVKYHGDQQYGNRPYQFHLEDVISVLNENGLTPSSELYIDLHIITWLHDVLEDTGMDASKISDQFGQHILNAVLALTDGDGENRKEKKAAMMKKLVQNQLAIIVKLADRISNVRISIQDNNTRKLEMYRNEHPNFAKQVGVAIKSEEGQKLLNHLNAIIS